MRGTFREPMTERRVDGRGYPLPALLFFSVDAEGRIERGNAGGVEGAPTPTTAARRAAAFAELQAKVSATPGAGELDPEEEQALRALGYVP